MLGDNNPNKEKNKDPQDFFKDRLQSESDSDTETLILTPNQYQELKNKIHGELFKSIQRAKRRYLIIGKCKGEPGKRRKKVRDELNRREAARSYRLEDFGLTKYDIELWVSAYEILTEIATHIIGVLEDYHGGYVWELGYLYRFQRETRDILWILKREYKNKKLEREKYDNSMAASHIFSLEKSIEDRVIRWSDIDELMDSSDKIP